MHLTVVIYRSLDSRGKQVLDAANLPSGHCSFVGDNAVCLTSPVSILESHNEYNIEYQNSFLIKKVMN